MDYMTLKEASEKWGVSVRQTGDKLPAGLQDAAS